MRPYPEYDELFKLPLAERLQLVEDLWDSIAAERQGREEVLPEALHQELHERQARYDADPASGISWDEAKRRLREA